MQIEILILCLILLLLYLFCGFISFLRYFYRFILLKVYILEIFLYFILFLLRRLGHVQIAQLLLTHGARADLECTVCYPEEHKLKTCPDQIYCLAYQPVYTPIMYALCGDNDQILTLLVTHENSRQLVKTDFLLHESCKMGSNACALYLLQHYSEQMSQENSEGEY